MPSLSYLDPGSVFGNQAASFACSSSAEYGFAR